MSHSLPLCNILQTCLCFKVQEVSKRIQDGVAGIVLSNFQCMFMHL